MRYPQNSGCGGISLRDPASASPKQVPQPSSTPKYRPPAGQEYPQIPLPYTSLQMERALPGVVMDGVVVRSQSVQNFVLQWRIFKVAVGAAKFRMASVYIRFVFLRWFFSVYTTGGVCSQLSGVILFIIYWLKWFWLSRVILFIESSHSIYWLESFFLLTRVILLRS